MILQMKRTSWSLACLFVLACSGATDGGSPCLSSEQQLGNSLPTWCPEICTKLVQCNAESSQSSCESDCHKDVASEFLGKGNACAQLGLDFMSCASGSSCDALLQNKLSPCLPSNDAIDSACPGDSSTTPLPPANTTGSTPPPDGGNSTVPDPTSGGVTCSSGAHMIASIAAPGNMVCDAERTDCSDGNSYRVTCIYQASGTETCTCFPDGLSRGPFDYSGTYCPDVTVINSMCGWNLSWM